MKVTKKELTRITVFPPVHIPLPGEQTAYIVVNLEEILSEAIPSPRTCPSNSQPLQRLHGLQSAQITIASLAPNMPQWNSICPHPPSPTGLLLPGNLALCSMLAPSIARADGRALGAGGCRILKFPIKLA